MYIFSKELYNSSGNIIVALLGLGIFHRRRVRKIVFACQEPQQASKKKIKENHK